MYRSNRLWIRCLWAVLLAMMVSASSPADEWQPHEIRQLTGKAGGARFPAKQAWWASSQATSTVLLPDGNLMTAFGTGYRSQPNAQDMSSPRDVGLVQWRLNEKPVGPDRRIRDAAADSDLRNWLDPSTGEPVLKAK